MKSQDNRHHRNSIPEDYLESHKFHFVLFPHIWNETNQLSEEKSNFWFIKTQFFHQRSYFEKFQLKKIKLGPLKKHR